MKAYIFPGQGAQSPGMAQDLYDAHRDLFEEANDVLGFSLTDIMFHGSMEDLTQTKVTQPAIFVHSVAKALSLNSDFLPDMVAGHSLGEFSALVAAGAMNFSDGLRLVSQRALGMQAACEAEPSTMAAILGLEDAVVEKICADTPWIGGACQLQHPGPIGHFWRHRRRGSGVRSLQGGWGQACPPPASRWRIPQPFDGSGWRATRCGLRRGPLPIASLPPSTKMWWLLP